MKIIRFMIWISNLEETSLYLQSYNQRNHLLSRILCNDIAHSQGQKLNNCKHHYRLQLDALEPNTTTRKAGNFVI